MKGLSMSAQDIKCSISECKSRHKEVDAMSFADLEKYASRCSTCGNWILKDNVVAQETYQKISLKWAEEFNKKTILH